MRPCFGEICYGEKDKDNFLLVCKPIGASVIDALSICLVIAQTFTIDLIVRKKMKALTFF